MVPPGGQAAQSYERNAAQDCDNKTKDMEEQTKIQKFKEAEKLAADAKNVQFQRNVQFIRDKMKAH